MKKLLVLGLTLFSVSSFAKTTEVYCQFWNSLTHTPEGITLRADANSLETVVSAEQSVNPKSFEAVGLTIKFSKVYGEAVPSKFTAQLWNRSAQRVETVVDQYEKDLNSDKIENFVLTATVKTPSGALYISALCSPQN